MVWTGERLERGVSILVDPDAGTILEVVQHGAGDSNTMTAVATFKAKYANMTDVKEVVLPEHAGLLLPGSVKCAWSAFFCLCACECDACNALVFSYSGL